MKLLLVDGTNIVMRCAFGGSVAVDQSVDTATRMIARATERLEATHLIVAFDSAAPSWRKEVAPEYKAHRTTETHVYSAAAVAACRRLGWYAIEHAGLEADDIVATIAARVACGVVILSGDSDLLACVDDRVLVARPQSGGKFELFDTNRVLMEYGVRPFQLAEWKALVGEPGDNIAGVPGIGAKRATGLLQRHLYVGRLLMGVVPDDSKEAARVREHADAFARSLTLTTLLRASDLPTIPSTACKIQRRAVA